MLLDRASHLPRFGLRVGQTLERLHPLPISIQKKSRGMSDASRKKGKLGKGTARPLLSGCAALGQIGHRRRKRGGRKHRLADVFHRFSLRKRQKDEIPLCYVRTRKRFGNPAGEMRVKRRLSYCAQTSPRAREGEDSR